jgi:prepilin-type N-terminal cleavage/methylation domain-containing protein
MIIKKDHSKGFTLIELIVVVAIIAIISIVVVLTLNPFELLRQARDSNRISDMATVSISMALYSQLVGGSLGNGTTTYVSLSDTTSTCNNVGLPGEVSGWTYNCASSASNGKIDGTGWIPLSFQSLSGASPMTRLPVDPTNQSSSGLYYTYVTDGTHYEATAILESKKYKASISQDPKITNYPAGLVSVGTSFTLSPLFDTNGMSGYWPMDEGSGTIAMDYSGVNTSGTWLFTPPFWGPGKEGASGGYSSGNSNLSLPTASGLLLPSSSITVSAWVYMKAQADYLNYAVNNWLTQEGGWALFSEANGKAAFGLYHASTTYYASGCANLFTLSNWHLITGTYDGTTVKVFLDGTQCSATSTLIGEQLYNSLPWIIGANITGQPYSIDDARVYNRALSPAEIQAFYNSQN